MAFTLTAGRALDLGTMARTKDTGSTGRASASDRTSEKKPRKERWYRQVWAAYQMTRRQDPSVTWIMLGIVVGVIAIGVVAGILWGHPVYLTLVSVPIGLTGALLILTRRAERAAFRSIEGQPGASRAALGSIRRGWTFEDQPVAIDARSQDLVYRGVGRAGVVLVSEGPSTRVKKLLEQEQRRVTRVLPSVPVTTIQCGNDDGQIGLQQLPRKVQKLRPTLTKVEAAEVTKRLRALGAPKLPIPKGVDPMRMRPDRKGIRGR